MKDFERLEMIGDMEQGAMLTSEFAEIVSRTCADIDCKEIVSRDWRDWSDWRDWRDLRDLKDWRDGAGRNADIGVYGDRQ